MPQYVGGLVGGYALVPALVRVSAPHAVMRARLGLPPPGHAQLTLRIDTSADITCIDQRILRLLPHGMVDQTGMDDASGSVDDVALFDVALYVEGMGGKTLVLESLRVMELDLSAHGVDGLLGLDVLEQCRFVYDGINKAFSIEW